MQTAVQLPAMPAKSMAHRALICAALAKGESALGDVGVGEDVRATVRCLTDAGLCAIWRAGGGVRVLGGREAGGAPLDAGESAATLRLLLPALLDGKAHSFLMRGRLPGRPLDVYRPFCEQWTLADDRLCFRGTLRAGAYTLPGDVSSQFASGLALALPRLPGDSRLSFASPPQSRGYIELTLQVMRLFGVRAEWAGDTLLIPGGQAYAPKRVSIEGDYTHAAVLLALGALGGGARVTGLSQKSAQPDRAVRDCFAAMGVPTAWEEGALCVSPCAPRGAVLDVSQTPDLAPVLAALGCVARGETRLENAARLRLKESDRLRALAGALCALGADIREAGDALVIRGRERLSGGEVSPAGDHRVAMAAAVAALRCDAPVLLRDPDCVAKSAPQFFDEYRLLGGEGRVQFIRQ